MAKKNRILEKAYARELDYFAKNPEELFSKLKSYIKKDILSISKGEKTVDKSLETLYETTNHDKNDEIRKLPLNDLISDRYKGIKNCIMNSYSSQKIA